MASRRLKPRQKIAGRNCAYADASHPTRSLHCTLPRIASSTLVCTPSPPESGLSSHLAWYLPHWGSPSPARSGSGWWARLPRLSATTTGFAGRRMWWSFSEPAFVAAFCSRQSWSCWSRSTQRQCRYFCLPPSMSRARFGPLTGCARLRVREPRSTMDDFASSVATRFALARPLCTLTFFKSDVHRRLPAF